MIEDLGYVFFSVNVMDYTVIIVNCYCTLEIAGEETLNVLISEMAAM